MSNVILNRQIPSNAALYLDNNNDIKGIKSDIDPEENLIAMQQQVILSLMDDPNVKNLTMFTFYTSNEMKSHFHGDFQSINGFPLPKTEYIVDETLLNPIVVVDNDRISAINRLHKTMKEMDEAQRNENN